MGFGFRGLQDGREPVLHEHVYQHYTAGVHQPGQIYEVKGEGKGAAVDDGDSVWVQPAVELGGVQCFVGPVAGGADAHDRHGRGQRALRQMLRVQASRQKRQRESLLQRSAGGPVLVRLHHAGGLLHEDRLAAAASVTGQAGPSQRAEIRTNGQEVLFRPLPVHHLLRALPRLPSLLYIRPAQ